MAVLCICGVCVPYSIFWPVFLLFLKPLIDYFQAFFGLRKRSCEKTDNLSAVENCCMGNSEKVGTFSLSSDDNWSVIKNGSDLTFVRFTASWCLPCKKIEPTFLSLGAQNPQLSFVSIDVDQFDEIAAAYNAFSIPLFLAIRSGTVLGRLSGQDDKALTKFVEDTKEMANLMAVDTDQNLKLD